MASLALVSADGLVSLFADLGCVSPEIGALLPRRVAPARALGLTTGNLTLAFAWVLPLAVLGLREVVCREVVFVSFVFDPLLLVLVDLETVVRALVAVLLAPGLLGCGVRTLRLLYEREVESSHPFLRFAPAFVFEIDSLARSFSLGRGPSTPRQLSEPHRHC